MFLIRTRIGPSRIHGVGVFALEAVPADAVVWRYDPAFDRIITAEDLARSPPPSGPTSRRMPIPPPTSTARRCCAATTPSSSITARRPTRRNAPSRPSPPDPSPRATRSRATMEASAWAGRDSTKPNQASTAEPEGSGEATRRNLLPFAPVTDLPEKEPSETDGDRPLRVNTERSPLRGSSASSNNVRLCPTFSDTAPSRARVEGRGCRRSLSRSGMG